MFKNTALDRGRFTTTQNPQVDVVVGMRRYDMLGLQMSFCEDRRMLKIKRHRTLSGSQTVEQLTQIGIDSKNKTPTITCFIKKHVFSYSSSSSTL
mmetsp:Transcript_20569/g.59687  ORF Transcript_20569/g.59687 Transcript_20569/m.59687 type:complete len:95 (-) Transcript_20569:755-1039(-)